MNTTLKNPYYFVKNGLIFEISTNNTQEDPCGKHYKTFDTEIKALKKGDYYFDKNNTQKIAEEDGDFEVCLKTTEKQETKEANKAVFPYFEVTYQYKESGNIKTITYWLDDLISDGDEMNGTKFENKTVHTKDGETTISYVEFYKQQCLSKMAEDAVKGMTEDLLKSSNPFLFVGAETKINGVKATVTESTIAATEQEKMDAMKVKIKEYGDKILKVFEKTCNVTIE